MMSIYDGKEIENMTDYKQLLIKILLKKAKGYSFKEKTEEFNVVEGKAQLTKKKVVTKRVQPDVAAVKALLQLSEEQLDISKMSDEQLKVEKLRLLQLLNICDDATATAKDAETNNDSDSLTGAD